MDSICEQDLKWVLCPFCGSKTRTKLLACTQLRNYPLFCPKCKRTTVIDAQNHGITVKHIKPDV